MEHCTVINSTWIKTTGAIHSIKQFFNKGKHGNWHEKEQIKEKVYNFRENNHLILTCFVLDLDGRADFSYCEPANGENEL